MTHPTEVFLVCSVSKISLLDLSDKIFAPGPKLSLERLKYSASLCRPHLQIIYNFNYCTYVITSGGMPASDVGGLNSAYFSKVFIRISSSVKNV